MLIQFLYMQVSINFACCIVADDMGPIPCARISTIPAVKTSQWIYQAASDSLKSINCRIGEPILQTISLAIMKEKFEGMKNSCHRKSSIADLYTPLL